MKIKWKWLFLALLGFNIAAIILFFILVGIPQEIPDRQREKGEQQEAYITVTSTKDSLNQLISNYIQEFQIEDSMQYDVVLTDVIELYATLPVFSNELELKMTFKPIPLENGDLVLQQQSMELGAMRLPVSYVLNFIKKQNNYPEWLEIDSKNKEIYVSLKDADLLENVSIKVADFDLEKDNISFRLVIPDNLKFK